MNWYKIASYSYVENILSSLREFFPIVDLWDDPKGKKIATAISARTSEISRLSEAEYGTEDYTKLMQSLIGARAAMYSASKRMDELEEFPKLRSGFEETNAGKIGWMIWEREGNVSKKIKVIKGNPPQILLEGLDLGNSQVAQSIKQYMGDAFTQDDVGVHVRGTQESWNKFRSISNQWLENHNILRPKGTLPSEKDFDPNYQEEVAKKEGKPGAGLPLSASLLNVEGMAGSIDTSNQTRGKVYQGIRLSFDPKKDPNLYDIRDYIYKVGRRNYIFNQPEGYFDIFEQGDVKRKESLNQKTLSAVSLNQIKKRLQYMGYDGTGAIGPLITVVTGVSPELSRKRKAKITNTEGESDTVVEGRIETNVLPQLLVSNRFNVPEGQSLSQEQFNTLLEQNYPGAFGDDVPETQKEAQKNGMYFMASRTVSVLADEPGSGKTPMAVVSSDATRNEGQKILVITPGMLIRENWVDVDENGQPFAKAPGQFCGHSAEQIAVCKNPNELMEAITDPKIIWVVIAFSSFGSKGAKTQDLSNTIVKAGREGIFSSVIIDEIQTIKKKAGSVAFPKIAKAITPYHIPHRIGLTGTPSDNKPVDIFSQLSLLDHPVLYKNNGIENWTESLNQEGFANRFLGGTELSKGVTVPKNIRENSTEKEIEKYREAKWLEKAKKVLKWVKTLDDSKKLLILDLFSSTYLRRTKKDIRPDMPEKQRNIVRLQLPEDVQLPKENMNWHGKLLMDMAHRKIPTTIRLAENSLNSDPSNKVFIVTKHPTIADKIAMGLNNIYGEGSCAAVHEKTSDDDRSMISQEFKRIDGQGLRAVVYTMQLGAVGLNFDVASTCIFNDLDWNPSSDLQAEYRIHRITSKKPVNIQYVVFGDSYDEEMFNRVQKKDLINSGISDMIRQSNMTDKEDPERLEIANNFIKNIIDSILLDVDLSVKHQAWFDQQLDIILGLEVSSQDMLTAPPSYPVKQPLQQPLQQVASNWYARFK